MVEYVYALHDFLPEHEDEVSFHAGERVEVVEKDDLYGDGWWKACQVGLFPQSYTTSAPPQQPQPEMHIIAPIPAAPTASSILLSQESSSPVDSEQATHTRTLSSGEQVMQATLTDVQQAIEQLGRHPTVDTHDEARSFSFASSRGAETETDTDYDISDVDGEGSPNGNGNGNANGESWHKGARTKLAEKARRAVEEAEKLEAIMNGGAAAASVRAAPPIDVELSDESDVEGEEFTSHSSIFPRAHPNIAEEEEEEAEEAETEEGAQHVLAPARDEGQLQTATARRTSFEPVFAPAPAPAPAPAQEPPQEPEHAPTPTPNADADADPADAGAGAHANADADADTERTPSKRTSATHVNLPVPVAANPERYRESLIALPSPTGTGSFPASPAPGASRHDSVASFGSAGGRALLGFVQESENGDAVAGGGENGVTNEDAKDKERQGQEEGKESNREKKHPSEWELPDVIDWLKSRGFDQDVCDKFTEQEITGDVLLELDAALLKTELGIMAFGKRVRIANAIAELRRPPSVVYAYPHAPSSPGGGGGQSYQNSPLGLSSSGSILGAQQAQGQGQGHGRAASQAYSQRSFPGSTGSPAAPPGYPIDGLPQAQTYQQLQLQVGQVWPLPSESAMNGHRPAHLMLSPASDGALKATAFAGAMGAVIGAGGGAGGGVGGRDEEGEEDRGVASESEALPPSQSSSMRRRLFGRSYDSTTSSRSRSRLDSTSRHSKDGSVSVSVAPSLAASASPVVAEYKDKDKEKADAGEKDKEKDEKDKEKDKGEKKEKEKVEKREKRPSSKRGSDGSGGAGDRLSIFGGAFAVAGSLGKGRKPPPRYAGAIDETPNEKPEKASHHALSPHSIFTLPRLTSTSRKSSGNANANANANSASSTPLSAFSTPAGTPKVGSRTVSTTSTLRDTPRDRDRDSTAPNTLRKRTSSAPAPQSAAAAATAAAVAATGVKQGQSILEQIGDADYSGWMRKKGDRYNSWKLRYFVLKGADLYWLRSNSPAVRLVSLSPSLSLCLCLSLSFPPPFVLCASADGVVGGQETKIKGYINIMGYKVTVDENVNPGRYGFRIDHDSDKTHYFSSDEKGVIRDWMKAIMKATIGRDYSKPVISSCNIPTIPLMVAQAMNPAPRPPSPTARAATQKALRRENTNQLSTRDARILMGLPSSAAAGAGAGEGEGDGRKRVLEEVFTSETVGAPLEGPMTPRSPVTPISPPASASLPASASVPAPARPSREMRRSMSVRTATAATTNSEETALIEWANSHLPMSLQMQTSSSTSAPLCGGLELLRVAESIKGKPVSPPVLDSEFPSGPTDDKLEGLFKLFDFMLDNDVKLGAVSINDVRQGKREKILQLLKALRTWEDKRRALASSLGTASSVQSGAFMAPVGVAVQW
ncbi:hypothetical protein H0H92_012109 [Tricholoma furcatifolium]|nr:hypothetical protein H0H92_012109 [Tricholoma furcatifolium]